MPPTLVSPAATPYLSNTSALTVSGGCTDGFLVYIQEQLPNSTASPISTTCSGGSYTLTAPESADGTYSFVLYQQSVFEGQPLDFYSSNVSLVWQRDTTPPAAPVITSPASNPYTSAGNSVTISGTCEDGATVYLGGASSQSQTCASSAFSFTYNNSTDGTYFFTLRQVDPAGNGTSAPFFTWTREGQPSTPQITSPATTPFYSNSNNLVLSGTCTAGYQVNLSGVSSAEVSSPAGSLTETCSGSGTFSYTVTETADAVYTLTVSQTNTSTSMTSSGASIDWHRDATAPGAVTLTSIGSDPYYSNGSSIALSGACEPGDLVSLSGSDTQSTTCSGSGTYTMTVSESTDASYSFNLKQTDLAANSSPSISQTWVRDTSPPASPTRTTPSSNPFTSGDTTITISGSCENNATVTLHDTAAATDATMTCASSAYSFSVTKSVDGTYGFDLWQTDRAGNSSGTSSFTWTRDTTVLATPTVTSPSTEPDYSTATTLTIDGGCATGATVNLSGASTQSYSCTGTTYTFSVTETTDGTYSFSIDQTLSGKTSSTVGVTWVLDRTAPAAPALSSPAATPFYSNGSILTIQGTCESGATVDLSGADTQSLVCPAGGTYSFNVSKSADSTYDFSLTQTDLAGNTSTAVTQRWVRDTAVPTAPTITSPASSPYLSSGSLTLSGGCETGDTVTISGDVLASDVTSPAGSLTETCASSAYSFTISKSSDATYNLSLAQQDKAGNTSASTAFQWIRSSGVPATPTITSPTVNPMYSNLSSITISGGCTSGLQVDLNGDSTQIYTCSASGTYTFTVNESVDGTYKFFISQENTTTGDISAEVAQTWIRDTVAPAALGLLNPVSTTYSSSGDLLIQGKCEVGTTVNLTGADTQSTTCSSAGTFEFSVTSITVDGTYSFSIAQVDAAGNSSTVTAISWTRDSTLPATPTISSPGVNPYVSAGSSLTISGGCTTGLTVELSGSLVASDVTSPAGSLTETCSGGAYSFTVAKNVDNVYDFVIDQTNGSATSGGMGVEWVRDIAPPVISLDSQPASPNLAMASTFSFSANELVTFECSLDGAAFSSCTSPLTYAQIANGSHTFEVRGTDTAGNLGNTASYAWTQSSYKTVALYHMDAAAPTVDSGLYVGGNNNAITTSSGNTSATAKFAEGRQFSNGVMSAPDSPSLGAISGNLTVEAWVRTDANLPNGNNYWVIAGQHSATGTDYGWELRVRKGPGNGTKIRIGFFVSTGASTGTEIRSSSVVYDPTVFHHIAATYNAGSVRIFLDGQQIVSGSTSTVVLNNSTTALRIGQDASGANAASCTIDEVRISQVNRYPAPFTPPSSAFSAD